MSLAILIDDNIATLRQAEQILSCVQQQKLDFSSKIGPHLRHVLDHYDCFLNGLPHGQINYDERSRDTGTEREPQAATQRITRCIARLNALTGHEMAARVLVKLATSAEGNSQETWSAPERELQFLQSHAVHHYALIRLIMQTQGVELGEDFGKAPSTIRHELATA